VTDGIVLALLFAMPWITPDLNLEVTAIFMGFESMVATGCNFQEESLLERRRSICVIAITNRRPLNSCTWLRRWR
jgi:hypothetical protein